MKVGDLIKDIAGELGIIVRIIEDDWGTHGSIYVVQRFSGYKDQLFWDELEVLNESR